MNRNNIIIFRTDRLGDYLIHSRPIYELRRKIKNSYVIVVCSETNKKILSNISYVDEIIIYNKNFNFLKKTKVFINLLIKKYHSCFVLDGKKFSFFTNMFLFSKKKFGVIYKKKINTKCFQIDIFKPSKIYAKLFFTKFEVFTSKKYLSKVEPLQQKYINLFNYFDLNIKIEDSYIFENTPDITNQFSNLKDFYNLNEYFLIHFDEKWLDVTNINQDLINGINYLQSILNKKIIISGYKNFFQYFINLENFFPCVNFEKDYLLYNEIKNENILIFKNMNIKIFEQFIKNSIANISCHSGFLVQVCGANNGRVIDIINKQDLLWYSCWKPLNTKHNFIFKSDVEKKITIKDFFNEIVMLISD